MFPSAELVLEKLKTCTLRLGSLLNSYMLADYWTVAQLVSLITIGWIKLCQVQKIFFLPTQGVSLGLLTGCLFRFQVVATGVLLKYISWPSSRKCFLAVHWEYLFTKIPGVWQAWKCIESRNFNFHLISKPELNTNYIK